MLQEVIARYKRRHAAALLACRYQQPVAIVGLGGHCLTNIVPVLEQLRVPIGYICVRSQRTAALAAQRFPEATIVDTPDPILADPAVASAIITTPASQHFGLANRVLQSGKSLFVEKPPCLTLDELLQLVHTRQHHGTPAVQVGLQKSYAPAVAALRQKLLRHPADHYLFRYCTGAYPEGDALTDLFIHPLHLVCHLFGPATLSAHRQTRQGTLLLQLDHGGTIGALELSTAYSWQRPVEELIVATSGGTLHLAGIERLIYSPIPQSIAGIPTDKIIPHPPADITLYSHDTFSPTAAANSLVSNGFYAEIRDFLDAAEHKAKRRLTTLESLVPVYRLLEELSAERKCN